MKLAKVIGNVVATANDESLKGVSLLYVQPLDAHLKPEGSPIVATDALTRRGVGEIVFLVTGGDATPTGIKGAVIPSDAAVMGIANQVTVNSERKA